MWWIGEGGGGGGGVFDEISLTVSYCTFLLCRSVFVSLTFARQMNTAPIVTCPLAQANIPSCYHTQ